MACCISMTACAQAWPDPVGGRDSHSRMVGWLKVTLPLVALALLSTLFLLSDRIDPSDAIPYAKVDVQDLANDPRMSAPAYAGTTSDGAGITLSANRLTPGSGQEGTSADGVSAQLETPDGKKVDITASEALMAPSGNQVALSGGVTVKTEAGYSVTTDAMTADLLKTNLVSSTPVQVEAPMGDLRADGFTLQQDQSDSKSYLLVFNGSVRLLYQPGGQSPAP